ncbi:hypothetical protein ABW21_db0207170 [Orbilia brochopaga]|nr:hypothetical protein ABW21_db0207170 [Drechslerella brochopaga]
MVGRVCQREPHLHLCRDVTRDHNEQGVTCSDIDVGCLSQIAQSANAYIHTACKPLSSISATNRLGRPAKRKKRPQMIQNQGQIMLRSTDLSGCDNYRPILRILDHRLPSRLTPN